MSENKKQELLPPSSPRLPVASPLPTPSLPPLPTGTSVWPFERGRYERNTLTVAASANYMRARADQAAACAELVSKREELALAISRLHALPERCAFEYEKGRLSRHSELRCLQLKHELDETNAKIAVTQANAVLAQYLPQPEARPEPPPPPAPTGLTPADVEKIAQALPELKPETVQTLVYALGGLLAEKNR